MKTSSQEIDLLCRPTETRSTLLDDPHRTIRTMVVGAIGLAGTGRLIESPSFDVAAEHDWVSIRWPEAQAARLAAYYERYLSAQPIAPAAGWNGHNFVAAVMGHQVEWSGRTPSGLRLGDEVPGEELQDGQPYLIGDQQRVSQSVIAVGQGASVLAVAGYMRALQIMPSDTAQELWGGSYHVYAGSSAPDTPPAINPPDSRSIYDLPRADCN